MTIKKTVKMQENDGSFKLNFDSSTCIKSKLEVIDHFNPYYKASGHNGAHKFFKVENTSHETVYLKWIDWHGNLHHYKTIHPGGSATQNTYDNHNWVLVNTHHQPVTYLGSPKNGSTVTPYKLDVIEHFNPHHYASGHHGAQTYFHIDNPSDETLYLKWIDGHGNLHHYQTIHAGGSATQHSYQNHNWVLMNTNLRL